MLIAYEKMRGERIGEREATLWLREHETSDRIKILWRLHNVTHTPSFRQQKRKMVKFVAREIQNVHEARRENERTTVRAWPHQRDDAATAVKDEPRSKGSYGVTQSACRLRTSFATERLYGNEQFGSDSITLVLLLLRVFRGPWLGR
ncbi:hypothetical protein CBL_01131 [Carabus blaptoides fortunei]